MIVTFLRPQRIEGKEERRPGRNSVQRTGLRPTTVTAKYVSRE